jgi:Zn-dependent protease
MDLSHVNILFQIIVFLLAISVHESAHAWMANRCGDPTARMLGRVTLNPIKHIDPIGTVLLPLIGMLTGAGIFGWAKPCPVTPENFRDKVRGDVYTTIAGPVSNLLMVSLATTMLILIAQLSPGDGRDIIQTFASGYMISRGPLLVPVVWFLYTMIGMNVLLFVFNLLPVPPLDGSHVFRYLLPEPVRDIYDSVGMLGIVLLFLVGGPLLRAIMQPIMHAMDQVLLRL